MNSTPHFKQVLAVRQLQQNTCPHFSNTPDWNVKGPKHPPHKNFFVNESVSTFKLIKCFFDSLCWPSGHFIHFDGFFSMVFDVSGVSSGTQKLCWINSCLENCFLSFDCKKSLA